MSETSLSLCSSLVSSWSTSSGISGMCKGLSSFPFGWLEVDDAVSLLVFSVSRWVAFLLCCGTSCELKFSRLNRSRINLAAARFSNEILDSGPASSIFFPVFQISLETLKYPVSAWIPSVLSSNLSKSSPFKDLFRLVFPVRSCPTKITGILFTDASPSLRASL